MRYILFSGGTDYCGTKFEDCAVFDDGTPDSEIDNYANALAIDNGETFEYLHTGWDGAFEDEEDEESYYASCYCEWAEVSKEEYETFREEHML